MANSPALHRIHLRGPWSLWLNLDDVDSTPLSVKLPGDWPLSESSPDSVVVYTRRFHAPARPLGDEQVWLLFPGVGGHGEVRLNGKFLGTITTTPESPASIPAQLRIDGLMEPFNTLEVRLVPAGPVVQRGLYGAAILEFRSP
jgi:hypothetical protein